MTSKIRPSSNTTQKDSKCRYQILGSGGWEVSQINSTTNKQQGCPNY